MISEDQLNLLLIIHELKLDHKVHEKSVDVLFPFLPIPTVRAELDDDCFNVVRDIFLPRRKIQCFIIF